MAAFREKAEPGLRLTVMGARGSMAVGSGGRELFGGATSCYLAEYGGDCVVLDAGSGLLSAPAELPGTPLILLSHLHLDHVLGLGMFLRLSQEEKTILCLPARDAFEAQRLIDRLYAPPFWPVRLGQYRGELEILPLRLPMTHGGFRIEGMEGSHPGGCMVFRLSAGGRSLVYATDFEHTEPAFSRLAAFASGTDLLLYDGQYTPEEYRGKRGFGHSTAEKGVELMERCGAKRLLLIHHDPQATDQELLRREERIGRADVRYAREGEEIAI